MFFFFRNITKQKNKKFLLSFSFFISIAYKYFTDYFGKNNNSGYVLKHLFPHARSLIFFVPLHRFLIINFKILIL